MKIAVLGAQLANIFSLLVGMDLLNFQLLWAVLIIHIFFSVPVAGTFMGGFDNMDDPTFKSANVLIVMLILNRLLWSTIAFGLGYIIKVLFF